MHQTFRFAFRHLLFSFGLQLILWLAFIVFMPFSFNGLEYAEHFSKLLYKIENTLGINTTDILSFLFSGTILRTLLIFGLTFPLCYGVYKQNLGTINRTTRLLLTSLVLITNYLLFCIAWCPTLFVDLLKVTSNVIFDGYLLYPYSMAWLPLTFFLIYRAAKTSSRGGFYISFSLTILPYALFTWEKVPTSSFALNLPDKSIVLVLADSLRADHLNARFAPLFHETKSKWEGAELRGLVAPSESTVASVASIFTGKFPHQNQVRSAYSKPLNFENDSLIHDLKLKGYCTIGISYYSENSITRNDFGFDDRRDMISDYSYKYLTSFLLKRDPLLTATLSMDKVYQFTPRILRSSYDFLSGAPSKLKIIEDLKSRKEICGDKPIFAFLFFQEPHYEYPTTFPTYLEIPFEKRRYSILSDFYSNQEKEITDPYISQFYGNSIQSIDLVISKLIQDNLRDKNDNSKTFIFSSDHGEYLGENGHYLHGETLGPLSAGMSPFAIFGRGRELYPNGSNLILQNTELRSDLNLIASHAEKLNPPPRAKFIYRETEIWPWGENLKMNFNRVLYPVAWEGLLEYSLEGTLVLAPAFEDITEYAKHRQWIVGDITYDIAPQEGKQHLIQKNGYLISKQELPPMILEMLKAQSPRLFEELR